VPANTSAEVWVPNGGGRVEAPSRATLDRVEGEYSVYSVPSGEFSFTSPAGA
jgi:alpha-L-rhamnosidase